MIIRLIDDRRTLADLEGYEIIVNQERINPATGIVNYLVSGSQEISITNELGCLVPFRISKEICDNGIDDDGDGYVDCEDLDCYRDSIGTFEARQKGYFLKSMSCTALSEEETTCLNEYRDWLIALDIKDIDNAVNMCSQINALLDSIGSDPYAFFTDCFDVSNPNSFWTDLAAFRVPSDIVASIESRGTQWYIHEMNDAEGSVVNADYYSVNLGSNLMLNGQSVTPQAMFDSIRLNFLEFDDGCNTTFGLDAGASNEQDKDTWLSNNPVGAVVDIDITPNFIFHFIPNDDATVVTSSYNNDATTGDFNWTFSTISSPFYLNGDHPVSGHRQFGIVQDQNGDWIFYTRGLDRITDNWMPFVDDNDIVLDGGHQLWVCLTSNIANSFGGVVKEPIVHRPDWELIKNEILNLPVSDIIKCVSE